MMQTRQILLHRFSFMPTSLAAFAVRPPDFEPSARISTCRGRVSDKHQRSAHQVRRCQLQLTLAAQLVQHHLGLFQMGRIEAFGEPVVDFGEHGAGFPVSVHPLRWPDISVRPNSRWI